MLRTSPQNWRSYLTLARTIITHLDTTTFVRQANRTQEQIWVVTGLQRLALVDADSGGVPDITAWCSRQWLVIGHRDADNLAALKGLGEAWLSKAQPALVRIHEDGSPSSRAGSAHSQRSFQSFNSVRDGELSTQQVAEAERRAATTDYVEARGYLQPATDYLERAITAATAQRAVSGELLATSAEAYMSIGNASSPRMNEQYFRRALQLLRAATEVDGYSLATYLQQ
ncbi:hypothetical protein CLAFUW4_08033 [Fulvia fulva]|uniref:Uncharacterized protein n=1 Tax=Passalora fulva TaxID=5499 RepID=A0A9Q8LD09_PASFU|nr:uncharacterized protein CLAFUR5_08151 [Fulvia fulva]KAK4628978.1 hypothetical protein CLAFUR4_08038 [Fulvia fulva]KAK4630535.1 hypothetical protein CLAFUR0_08033 [Fulvia fulva]UJO15147.1 hypothetical protein CLAFUR5_08151 [Fulvia fulva]WPV12936.1 hypothetical protein CLAFUW4_08033 [Fulvia fulva]WPV27063.1 hypothetical protein CLAFUW7_08033 [Fulvia fulva]